MEKEMRIAITIILASLLLSCTVPSKETGEQADETPSIIIYSDFECPYSKHFYSEILPRLREDWIDNGSVKLVFRHLPLNSIHPNAHKAAEAAECARDEGMFWEMHDMLFEHGAGDIDTLKTYGRELGLSEEFVACLDSNATRQRVIDDFYGGIGSGVKGTPALIINGSVAPPMRSYEELDAYLRDTLS